MSNSLEYQNTTQPENLLGNPYFQQLLPLAGEQAQALLQDECDSDQLLTLALNVLITGDFLTRWDVAKLIPKLAMEAHSLGQSGIQLDEAIALGESLALIAPLITCLQEEDTDWELRWFVIRILGEFDHPAIVPTLIEALKTAENEELSAMAAAALANQGAKAVAALTDLLAETNCRLLAVRSLSQIRRSETIAPLLSVVDDLQPSIRAAAIEALASFHDPRIPPVLVSALADPVASVRREAVIGLGLRADLAEKLDLVKLLQPRLRDLNLEVCRQAAIALGRVGTAAAAAALFEVLQFEVLRTDKSTGISETASSHTPMQVEVIRALGWSGTASALEYLQQSLNLELWQGLSLQLCQEIVATLGRVEQTDLKPRAAQILIDRLDSKHSALQNPGIKQAIALSLGQLGQVQALDPLIQLLADPNPGVRLHAIAALKQLDSQTAHQRLEALATQAHLSTELKQGVAIALAEWL